MSRRKTDPEQQGLHAAAAPDDTHLFLWRLKTELDRCAEDRDKLSLHAVLGVCVCFAPFLFAGLFDVGADLFTLAGFTACVALGARVCWSGSRIERRRAELWNELADVSDVRALPLLLDELVRNAGYMTTPDDGTRDALLRLLPRVGPDGRGLLNTRQRVALYEWLDMKDAELAEAVLSALRHVAAVDAVPHLRPLADGKGLARRNERICRAAQEVLAGLEQRLTVQAQPMELLRGASEPEQPATALLRPAHNAHEAPPDELPRASVRPT